MGTATSRIAALAFGAAAFVLGPVPVGANEVSELCRTSVHQTDGAESAAPDICAAIETGASGEKPRVVDAGRTVEELAAAAEKADFVLLGEIHDNPSHHRIRAQIILAIAAQRAKASRPTPGLVLEHIRADQALAVAGFRAIDRVQRRSVDDLFTALDWKKSGWPPEALFRPMIEAALDVEWPIIHGNLANASIRAVAKGGIAALDAEETKRLGLDTALPDIEQSALLDELVRAHCGVMQRTALTTMADAQRYRDAYMANQIVDAARTHQSAVLLAGDGHVRRDRAVPWHLQRMAPTKRSLIVLFSETEPQRKDALSYAARGAEGRPLADFVVITPRVERPDPCIEMKKRFLGHSKDEQKK